MRVCIRPTECAPNRTFIVITTACAYALISSSRVRVIIIPHLSRACHRHRRSRLCACVVSIIACVGTQKYSHVHWKKLLSSQTANTAPQLYIVSVRLPDKINSTRAFECFINRRACVYISLARDTYRCRRQRFNQCVVAVPPRVCLSNTIIASVSVAIVSECV